MILVDIDVLIAHLRGIPAAGDWLVEARTQAGGPGAASVVIATEILGGMRRRSELGWHASWPPSASTGERGRRPPGPRAHA